MTPIPGTSPTAADWLSAWSTFGAAVGTVGALLLGLRLLWRDRRRMRREQARLVRGYIEAQGKRLLAAQGNNYGGIPSSAKYVVVNDSPEPVYRVRIPHLADGGTTTHELIPPGESRSIPLSAADHGKFRDAHGDGNMVVPLAFSFADAASLRWSRSANGRLHGGRRYRWGRDEE